MPLQCLAGAGGRFRERVATLYIPVGKVFKSIREQIQPVAGRGREAPGGGGDGYKGGIYRLFFLFNE